jgi:hypothetical protein
MKRETLEEYCQRYAMTEALRLAKARVKDQIKREGLKVWRFGGLAFRGQGNHPSRRGPDRGQSRGRNSGGGRTIDCYAKDRGMTVDDIAEAIDSAIGAGR